jgi:hypothetical protein
MASESTALSRTVAEPRPLLDKVRGWLTTVDHKRLAILYSLFALAFLAIGGIELTIMRLQLVRPLNDFVWPPIPHRPQNSNQRCQTPSSLSSSRTVSKSHLPLQLGGNCGERARNKIKIAFTM